MATCPRCKTGVLGINRTLDLGSVSYSDDYVFKTFACSKCPLVGAGYYEESRRGSGESWHHVGYEIGRADYDRVCAEIATCPAEPTHRVVAPRTSATMSAAPTTATLR